MTICLCLKKRPQKGWSVTSFIADEGRGFWWLGLPRPPRDTGRWPHAERFKHNPKLCRFTGKMDRPCGKLPCSGTATCFWQCHRHATQCCVWRAEHLSDAPQDGAPHLLLIAVRTQASPCHLCPKSGITLEPSHSGSTGGAIWIPLHPYLAI